MGVGFDLASSVLLCAEDNSSIYGFDDEESGMGCQMVDANHQRSDLYVESIVGFPLMTDECMELLVSKEVEHLPQGDYAKRLLQCAPLMFSIRRDAIDWIEKVHAYYRFGPTTVYLSVNYLDRFLSCYEIPQGKEWMVQLLSVSCLSLAAKMEEAIVPLSQDLQVCEPRYVFEAKTIWRMELLVLGTLQWRMRALTPFSFIDYFLRKFSNAKTQQASLLLRSFELIKNTIKNTEFLEFRPSQIALAVAIFLTRGNNVSDYRKFLSSCLCVNKEGVMRCYDMIKAMALMNTTFKCPSGLAYSMLQDPNEVFDSLSNNSEVTTVGSQQSSHHFPPDAKRRRLYGLPTMH